MPRPFVHDQWAPIAYSATVGDGTSRPPGARSWVDGVDARRLAVYERLSAYLDNVSRFYLPDTLWEKPAAAGAGGRLVLLGPSPAEKYREYGDPSLLVTQARSFVLGDEQNVVIPDAAPLPDDAEPEVIATQERAALFADWVEQWVEQEALWLRLMEGEELTIGLSDGVYEITWDAEEGVPRIEVHDPGFYFPVLTGPTASKSGRYPNRIHLAWEEPDQETGKNWLFRKTYSRELLPDDETRTYRWQAPGDRPSRWTVYYTSARWDLSKIEGGDLYDLSDTQAVYDVGPDGVVLDRVDLGIDYIPLVHVPNDAAGRRHFGRGLLLRVAQLLDELANTDTDLAANSADLGSPPVVTTGAPTTSLPAGPGAQWNFPTGGTAELLDTSHALDAQLKYLDQLLSRLSRNSRLAKALLGDVGPQEVPSGYSLELGFAATKNLIREMRLVRTEKLPLIPRFAMRMAQQFQPFPGQEPVLPDGPTPRAEIRLGPFMPADKQAAVDRVDKLMRAHAISTLTAAQMLIDAGFALDDAAEEVARIKAEWGELAVQVVEATGDVNVARDMLGLAPAVVPVPPPAGGA